MLVRLLAAAECLGGVPAPPFVLVDIEDPYLVSPVLKSSRGMIPILSPLLHGASTSQFSRWRPPSTLRPPVARRPAAVVVRNFMK